MSAAGMVSANLASEATPISMAPEATAPGTSSSL